MAWVRRVRTASGATAVQIAEYVDGRRRIVAHLGSARQEAKERIFDISNLAELDRGRAVVLASGAPATLVRTLPWYTGPHKEAVEASIKANSPRRKDDDVLVPASEAAAANPWITK